MARNAGCQLTAEITTRFAPPSMWAWAFVVSMKTPVDSQTKSAPDAPQGILEGSFSMNQLIGLPSTINLPALVSDQHEVKVQ